MSKTQVTHDHYAFGVDNWGCGTLPNGDEIYEGEEVVRDVKSGELWSADTARKNGFEFIDNERES